MLIPRLSLISDVSRRIKTFSMSENIEKVNCFIFRVTGRTILNCKDAQRPMTIMIMTGTNIYINNKYDKISALFFNQLQIKCH